MVQPATQASRWHGPEAPTRHWALGQVNKTGECPAPLEEVRTKMHDLVKQFKNCPHDVFWGEAGYTLYHPHSLSPCHKRLLNPGPRGRPLLSFSKAEPEAPR